MAGKTNHSQFAILGHLLSNGPMSGYDIKKESDESTAAFWRESLGHLYPTLKQLVRQGWIEPAKGAQQAGKRERICYQITDAGKAAFADWLSQPVEQAPPRQLLLLKLFFGRHADPEILLDRLGENLLELKNQLRGLTHLKTMLTEQYPDHSDLTYWVITIDYGIAMVDAKMQWLQRTMMTLKNKTTSEV